MRLKLCGLSLATMFVFMGSMASDCKAQTWTGLSASAPAGSLVYEWLTDANWDSAARPTNTSSVIFGSVLPPTDGIPRTSVSLVTGGTAGNITFNGVAPSFTIGNSGESLIFGGGSTGNITKNSTNAQTINANLTIGGSSRTIVNNAAGLFTFGGSVSTVIAPATGASLTINNTASGGGYNFTGAGGVSTGTGALTVSNSAASNISFGSSVTANGGLSVTNSAAGTVTLSGAVSNSGANALAVSNTGAGNVNINGSVTNGNGNVNVTNSSTGAVTFSGNVARGASSVLNVTNNGSGSVVFNGSLTGGNGVSVTGTGLVRLGDGSGDAVVGNVTVGSGGLLDGLATVNGAMTISGGTYSPGLGTIGTQQLGSTLVSGAALVANAGSTFEFDLNSSLSDVINLSGRDLTLSGAAGTDYTVRLNLLSAITPPVGVPGTISWDVFTNVGNALSLDLSKLTVDSVVGNLTGTAFRTDQFFWSVTGASSNTLTLSAVPEPSSMALVGLVGIGAAGFARRRMKKATKKEVA